MEWKIGEIRQINGEWYQCINPKIYGCSYCDLQNKCIDDIEGKLVTCHARYRSDKKCVVFKKLEKLGEPYFNGQYGKVLQEYKYYIPPITPDLRIHIIKLGIVGIEIKQNQKDMKEKKIKISKEDATYLLNELHYILDERLSGEGSDKVMDDIIQILDIDTEQSNLKPFNLEEAKAGKLVCTRDGRKARIICFDRVTNSTNEYTGPLIVLVTNLNGDEKPFCYTENGNLAGDEYDNHKWDLMMLSEKKSGWANIVKGSDGCPHMGRGIFQSKEVAEDAIKAFSSKLIDTIEIEWYE